MRPSSLGWINGQPWRRCRQPEWRATGRARAPASAPFRHRAASRLTSPEGQSRASAGVSGAMRQRPSVPRSESAPEAVRPASPASALQCPTSNRGPPFCSLPSFAQNGPRASIRPCDHTRSRLAATTELLVASAVMAGSKAPSERAAFRAGGAEPGWKAASPWLMSEIGPACARKFAFFGSRG